MGDGGSGYEETDRDRREKLAPWHKTDSKANKNGSRRLIVLDDGTEYVGSWANNLRHGLGEHYTAQGVYEGDFVDDLYEGEGVYYLWSDETNCDEPGKWKFYEGQWEEGKFSGQGRRFDLSGDIYEGEFYRGKACGEGEMTYANQDCYHGMWDADMRNGEGNINKANGDRFVGVYLDDKRNGQGVLHIEKTKRKLVGLWVDDMFKCGEYYDEQEDPVYAGPDDISGTTDGMIPELQLKNADDILQARLEELERNE